MNVLDTAGQEDYENLQEVWIKQCQGFILVYDITSESSLLGLTDIIEKIKRKYYDYQKGDNSTPIFPCVIVGNKSDLEKERVIPFDMGKKFASDSLIESQPNERFQKGLMPYFVETSAKNDVNIEIPFRSIIYQLNHYLEYIDDGPKNVTGTLDKKKKSIFSSFSEDDEVNTLKFKNKK